MPSGEEIRDGLKRAAADRVRAKGQLHKADNEVARWLRAARDSEDVTMTEAARLVGLARKNAYALAKKGADS